MFLLFLGLGAASVKAQVRIGGNAAPNASALLDLNATDAAIGTKGLALPRVSLASDTMQLTIGVVNLTGMLVYNTTATLGAGLYSWTGSRWKKVDVVPAPTSADSGLFLISNGSFVAWQRRYQFYEMGGWSINTAQTPKPANWTIIADTTVRVHFWKNKWAQIPVNAVRVGDICLNRTGTDVVLMAKSWGYMGAYWLTGDSTTIDLRFTCFR